MIERRLTKIFIVQNSVKEVTNLCTDNVEICRERLKHNPEMLLSGSEEKDGKECDEDGELNAPFPDYLLLAQAIPN